MPEVTIDIIKLKAELQDLAGSTRIKVKLDKRIDVASRAWHSDGSVTIFLNPNKIRSQAKLETQLDICRQAVSN